MHGKAADKLSVAEPEHLLLAAMAVVFVVKGYTVGINLCDTVVGYGHLVGPVTKSNNSSRILLCNGVGVAPEVFYHLHGMGKRTLGVDHPCLCVQRVEQWLSRLAALPDLLKVSGPEHTAHGLYREQEFALIARRLPISLFAQPAAGHNAVQVWMQGELLAPPR